MSERRACEVVEQPRSTQRYEPQEADDEGRIVTRMQELVRAPSVWVIIAYCRATRSAGSAITRDCEGFSK